MDMKIKTTRNTEYTKFTLPLPKPLCAELDRLAGVAGISRTKLIEAILKQAVNDPKFVLEV
jgi:metal-responsive CopG/Arc/MetJ family transcriptional regulator